MAAETYYDLKEKELREIERIAETFMRKLNKVLHKCFRKVGQRKEYNNTEQESLYNRWKKIKNKDDLIFVSNDALSVSYFEQKWS